MKHIATILLLLSLLTATPLPSREYTPGNNLITIRFGAPLLAGGPFVSGAKGAGSSLFVDTLVNSGYLISPEWDPILKNIGPVYHMKNYSVDVYQGGFEWEHFLTSSLSTGLFFNYTEVLSDIELPNLFISEKLWQQLNLPFPGYYPVSHAIRGTSRLGGLVEGNIVLTKHLRTHYGIRPFLKASVGVGRGWLGESNGGPPISSVQIRGGAGFRRDLTENIYLQGDVEGVIYNIWSSPTSPIQRTRVVVNPGSGSMSLFAVHAGIGFPLSLSF